MTRKKDSLYFHPERKTKPGHKEEVVQRACVRLLYQIENMLKCLTFCHVPNQLLRRAALRMIYWALGVRAGVPDLIIFIKGGKTIFVELKYGKNTESEDQLEYQGILKRLGFSVYTVAAKDAVDGQQKLLYILEENGLKLEGRIVV